MVGSPAGAVQLVNEEDVATWEALGHGGHFVCEVNSLLIDLQLLEHEGHEQFPRTGLIR
jgi:hypothetical protein